MNFKCLNRILRKACTENNLAVWLNFKQSFCKCKSAHSTHTYIEKCNINRIGFCPLKSCRAGCKLCNRRYIGRLLYSQSQCIKHNLLVIYSQCSHIASSFGIVMTAVVPLPKTLSTVRVPPHIAVSLSRIFSIPICLFLS